MTNNAPENLSADNVEKNHFLWNVPHDKPNLDLEVEQLFSNIPCNGISRSGSPAWLRSCRSDSCTDPGEEEEEDSGRCRRPGEHLRV